MDNSTNVLMELKYFSKDLIESSLSLDLYYKISNLIMN